MPENVSINSPIEIKDNSIERVAFDLTMHISSIERTYDDKEYRKELLRLYDQCLKTTSRDFERINFEKDDSTD